MEAGKFGDLDAVLNKREADGALRRRRPGPVLLNNHDE